MKKTMEQVFGGYYELEVETLTGEGLFEIWQNWGGVWGLLTTSTNDTPYTFASPAPRLGY